MTLRITHSSRARAPADADTVFDLAAGVAVADTGLDCVIALAAATRVGTGTRRGSPE